MRNSFFKMAFLAGAVAAFAGLPAAASAAVLLVDGNGQLTGARNVDVGGKSFDVQFVNGTCIGLFGGCDEDSDTDFGNETDALAAAQALLDQVFLDTPEGMFDSKPELTFGCSDVFFCEARIPFKPGSFVSFAKATNFSPDSFPDSTDVGFSRIDFDTAERDAAVYARFTESVAGDVPAPGALSLLGLGLAGLAVAGRRREAA